MIAMPDIIDFESEKDRRDEDRLLERDVHWFDCVDELLATMATLVDNDAIIAAGVLTMLKRLEANGMSKSEAKTMIASALSTLRLE